MALEGNIHTLIDAGLLRYDEEGNCNSVTTWQEHEQLLALKREEDARASELQAQMNQQLAFVPNEQRARPGQQLEPADSFHS